MFQALMVCRCCGRVGQKRAGALPFFVSDVTEDFTHVLQGGGVSVVEGASLEGATLC